jgi:hypothetical protein
MLKDKGTALFVAIANRPTLVLKVGWSSGAIFLLMSLVTHKWHWFPRGGAIMALCGFIVAVRESLLWRPSRPRVTTTEIARGIVVREGPVGTPVFPPGFGVRPVDPDMTQEEIDKQMEGEQDAWDSASEPEHERVVDEGDPGRPMRDSSSFSVDDLGSLQNSSILGVLGTLIWAFGDLLGGQPK